MINKDYHMHTTWCDGSSTAEEMVRAAVDMGLEEIGFSGHSNTPFDTSYCMSKEETESYRKELEELREKYRDRISIKIGLEMDRFSDAEPDEFDYVIGSVHYIRVPLPADSFAGEMADGAAETADGAATPAVPEGCLLYEDKDGPHVYIPIDESPQILQDAADAYFGGDIISLAAQYFHSMSWVADVTRCDIIGHFDLITKFNEDGDLFDENDPRYIKAWKLAVDRLVMYDIPFEINTGAMAKGYRTSPYPAKPVRDYIREKGGRFILSSDSHKAQTLCFAFEEFEPEL